MKESTVTTENQIDPELLECVTKGRIYYRCIKMVLSAFMYIFMILFPWIIEITIASQISFEKTAIVVLVCGILQTVIAIYGGFQLGTLISQKDKKWRFYNDESDKKDDIDICGSFWCESPTDFSTLLTGGYIIYCLPQWIVTNIIISWVLSHKLFILPFYVHMMIYMPILLYPTSVFVSYSMKKAMSESDYQRV